MFTISNLLVCCIMSMILLSPVKSYPIQDVPASKLTDQDAIQKAALFCKEIGLSITSTGKAEYPATDNNHLEKIHWQPCWRIIFPGEAELELVDATSTICYFRNDSFFHAHPQKSNSMMPLLSEKTAIQIATTAIKSTGQLGELSYLKADLDQEGDPSFNDDSTWYVLWNRVSGNVPYRDQHASVSIDAKTGEVTGLVLMFPTAPVANTPSIAPHVNIDLTAANWMETFGFDEASLINVTTQIVRPNNFWQSGDIAVMPKSPSVASVYNFSSLNKHYEVWIDAQTGAIIGGQTYSRKGINLLTQKQASPQVAIRAAQEVFVYHQNYLTSKDSRLIGKLSRTSNQAIFAGLQKADHVHFATTRSRLSYILVIKGKNEQFSRFGYNPSTGELGLDGETITMPHDFRVWVLNQKP